MERAESIIKGHGRQKFMDAIQLTLERRAALPRVIKLLEEFGKVTGLPPAIYRCRLEYLTGIPSLDPLTIDGALMRRSGYDHDKSCADNLEAMFSKRAREIADELLNTKKEDKKQ